MIQKETIKIYNPSEQSSTVAKWASSGWALESAYDLVKESTIRSPGYHHVELRFERDLSIPSNAEIKAREDEERKKIIITSEKTDLKVIYIGGGISALVGAVIGFSIFNGALGIFLGLWAGLGIGGNIAFIPRLFLTPFEWEMYDAIGCISMIFWIPCFLILRIVFPLVFVFAGLVAFAIAGPIWPLIRVLIKNKEIKKM
jgi:hypothetical protein